MRTQSINLADNYVNFQSSKKQKDLTVEELIAKSKKVTIENDDAGRTIITDNHIIVEHNSPLGKSNLILNKKEIRKNANEILAKILKFMKIEMNTMMAPKKEEPLLDINRIQKLTKLSNAELYAEYTLAQKLTNPELKSYEKDYHALDIDNRMRIVNDISKRIEEKKFLPIIMKGQPVSFVEKCLMGLNSLNENSGLKHKSNKFKSIKNLISNFLKKIH